MQRSSGAPYLARFSRDVGYHNAKRRIFSWTGKNVKLRSAAGLSRPAVEDLQFCETRDFDPATSTLPTSQP
jgi:hypothetical protein